MWLINSIGMLLSVHLPVRIFFEINLKYLATLPFDWLKQINDNFFSNQSYGYDFHIIFFFHKLEIFSKKLKQRIIRIQCQNTHLKLIKYYWFLQNGLIWIVLFWWMPSFERNQVSLMGFSLISRAFVDSDASYQAQEIPITILANQGIKTKFLPPRPVQF